MLVQGEQLQRLGRYKVPVQLDKRLFLDPARSELPEDFDFSPHFVAGSIALTNQFGFHIGTDELVIRQESFEEVYNWLDGDDPWEMNERLQPCSRYICFWDPWQCGFNKSLLLGGPYDGQTKTVPVSTRSIYVELFSNPPELDEEYDEPIPSIKGQYSAIAWDPAEKMWHSPWIPEHN